VHPCTAARYRPGRRPRVRPGRRLGGVAPRAQGGAGAVEALDAPRAGAVAACHYGIDRLKEIVPVWKREQGPAGQVWIEGSYHPQPTDRRDPTAGDG